MKNYQRFKKSIKKSAWLLQDEFFDRLLGLPTWLRFARITFGDFRYTQNVRRHFASGLKGGDLRHMAKKYPEF
jgi:hypothetical protein